MPDNWIIAAN